jgi:hypothetical protein
METMDKRQVVLQVDGEVVEDGGRVVAIIEGRELTPDQVSAIFVDGADVSISEE